MIATGAEISAACGLGDPEELSSISASAVRCMTCWTFRPKTCTLPMQAMAINPSTIAYSTAVFPRRFLQNLSGNNMLILSCPNSLARWETFARELKEINRMNSSNNRRPSPVSRRSKKSEFFECGQARVSRMRGAVWL